MKVFTLSQIGTPSIVDFSQIQELYKSPFPGQRSHRLHLKEASYLTKGEDLWGDQLTFHSVQYPIGTGRNRTIVHKLCDGYTRVLAVLQGYKQAPEKVLLITHLAPDYESAYALYNQFNSAKASKKSKHGVQSGVREASDMRGKPDIDCFNSGLLLRGALTSGLLYSGVTGADMRKKTSNAFDSLLFLDAMRLDKGFETTGVMAAYINIVERDRKTRPSDVKTFIRFINFQGQLDVENDEDNAIVMARMYHDERRASRTTSGKPNVEVIRDRMLAYYQYFRDIKDKGLSATLKLDMDLGAFKLAA